MRIVMAPDSFKGSIRAVDAAAALADGWLSVSPSDEVVLRSMADGGEGTLAAIAGAVPGARWMPVEIVPPVGDPRDAIVGAAWLRLPAEPGLPGGTGVVELASTSGIELLGERLAPWQASSDGFGAAIAAALDAGVSRLVLAIGSSASTDGGAGMLSALGARFESSVPVTPRHRIGSDRLRFIEAVDLTGLRPRPPGGVTVLTDVPAPLLGPDGSAAVYGPQKGFRAADLGRVDDRLRRYAGFFDVDPMTPGAGAAGGVGFALLAWGARLDEGAAEIAQMIGLPTAVAEADLIVTGEGAFDASSAGGKVPSSVAALAAASGVPVALVAGRIVVDADTTTFVERIALTDLAGSTGAALADPARWLRAAGSALARTFGR